jgi:competence protein ComEA
LIGLLVAGIILVVATPPRGVPLSLQPMPTRAPILVHVDGAVHSPGVYSLPTGSSVQDAIEAAGGLTENAETRTVNLARILQDGEQIYIPEYNSDHPEEPNLSLETAPQPAPDSPPEDGNQTAYPVNINPAQAYELETLPGIGPGKAADIISYREVHGPFMKIEDIMNNDGIAEGTFTEIKDLIPCQP